MITAILSDCDLIASWNAARHVFEDATHKLETIGSDSALAAVYQQAITGAGETMIDIGKEALLRGLILNRSPAE